MTTEFQSYDELFPGRFLKAGLFNNQSVTYTLKSVHREDLEGEKGPEPKIILSFTETSLQLVLAKVNAEAIKAMFGSMVPEWIGKRITFYPTNQIMPFPKRKNEPCIRVYSSPDITSDIRCEWTPPRRKPVVQVLRAVNDVAGDDRVFQAGKAAIAKASTAAELEAVLQRMDARKGDMSDEQMAQLEGLAAARAAALAPAAPAEAEGDPFNE